MMKLVAHLLVLLILVMPGHCALLTETLGEAVADTELPLDERPCPCGGICMVEGMKDGGDDPVNVSLATDPSDRLQWLDRLGIDRWASDPLSSAATLSRRIASRGAQSDASWWPADESSNERMCLWTI